MMLLTEAVRCPNRYRCPPWDELVNRASEPGNISILNGVTVIMLSSETLPYRGVGALIPRLLSAWLEFQGDSMSTEQANLLESQMIRIVRVSPNYRQVAYYALSWIRSSTVSDFLATEVRDRIGLSEDDREVAAEILGERQENLSLVRSWLGSDDLWLQQMAIVLIEYMNFSSRPKELQEAKKLLETIALDPGVKTDQLLRVLEVFLQMQDSGLAHVFTALRHHPDPEIRRLAVMGLE